MKARKEVFNLSIDVVNKVIILRETIMTLSCRLSIELVRDFDRKRISLIWYLGYLK